MSQSELVALTNVSRKVQPKILLESNFQKNNCQRSLIRADFKFLISYFESSSKLWEIQAKVSVILERRNGIFAQLLINALQPFLKVKFQRTSFALLKKLSSILRHLLLLLLPLKILKPTLTK